MRALTVLFYDLCFLIYAVAYLPFFILKGKHRAGFGERLGRVPENVRRSLAGRRVLWLHAVSVGEMTQALRLAAAVKEKHPAVKILLTATTTTGWEIARKGKSPDDELLYFPLDFSPCVRAFVRAVAPASLVLMETEIWPNLILELTGRGVPVRVINGRLSDRAFRRYRAIRFWLAPALKALTAVGAQDQIMRERFVALGVEPDRVEVTGNMKFDWGPQAGREAETQAIVRLLKKEGLFWFFAGSTHEGEEGALFGVARKLAEEAPGFRLLVAPRHLNRLPAIQAAGVRAGVRMRLLSELKEGCGDTDTAQDVYVLDRMGILASLYRMADAVFVGGSLVPAGGHNLVEPAYYEKPVLFGPHVSNFREMSEAFLKAGAGVCVKGPAEMEQLLRALMADQALRARLGKAAKALVARHQGATQRNIETLLKTI